MLILTALVALAYLVWRVPDVLTTAVGGIALALVLSFAVRFLSRFMPRGLSILLSFLLVVGLFVLAVLYLVPLVVEQFASLVSALPEIANTLGRYLQNTPSFLQSRGFLPGDAEQIITGLRDELANAAQAVAGNGLSGAFRLHHEYLQLLHEPFEVIFTGAYLLSGAHRIVTSPFAHDRSAFPVLIPLQAPLVGSERLRHDRNGPTYPRKDAYKSIGSVECSAR